MQGGTIAIITLPLVESSKLTCTYLYVTKESGFSSKGVQVSG